MGFMVGFPAKLTRHYSLQAVVHGYSPSVMNLGSSFLALPAYNGSPYLREVVYLSEPNSGTLVSLGFGFERGYSVLYTDPLQRFLEFQSNDPGGIDIVKR